LEDDDCDDDDDPFQSIVPPFSEVLERNFGKPVIFVANATQIRKLCPPNSSYYFR